MEALGVDQAVVVEDDGPLLARDGGEGNEGTTPSPMPH
jgi:hypothetical protein